MLLEDSNDLIVKRDRVRRDRRADAGDKNCRSEERFYQRTVHGT
jgi:hypothetical protein